MSIERKIAELLAEAKTLHEETTEVVVEDTIEEVVDTTQEVTNEEAEQIDELSKDTLRSYNKKASKQVNSSDRSMENHYDSHADTSSGDEAPTGQSKTYMKHYKRQVKRLAGMDKTDARLTKEDIDALMNGEELSEEFREKATTIYEAAVMTRVNEEVTRIEEEYDSILQEAIEDIKEGLVEKVDGYLNYVVEQWIAQNEIALESGMKSEILESFVEGMKGLFAEHYIEVPEEKFDVLGDMQEKLEQLETKLDETVASNVNLTKQINEQKRIASVSDAADGLADTDVEKFKGLAEELVYDDADSFKKKLQTIRENYFTNKSTTLVESVVTDSPVITEEYKHADPMMKSYLSVLNSIKK